MSTILPFDEEQARRVEAMYRTTDVIAQQQEVIHLLALEPGERVLDIGSGTGQQTARIGAAVGPSGAVQGIDKSASMIAAARAHCDQPWVEFQLGDATALPFDDWTFGAAVCTQVYEYVTEIDVALSELHRVLRPGGRALILDTDWDSIVWNTTDRARMRKVLEAWDRHLVDPRLPETLLPALRRAGFRQIETRVYPLLNTTCTDDTYSHWLIRFIESFVAAGSDVPAEDARDWAEDLRRLHEQAAYFFSLNRYLFLIRKSGP